MKKIAFEELKEHPEQWKEAVIVFSNDSFKYQNYPLVARSYLIHSSDDYFHGGIALYGRGLDGQNPATRLDWFILKDHPKWIVDYCYIVA